MRAQPLLFGAVWTALALVGMWSALEALVALRLARPLLPDAAQDFLALVRNAGDEVGPGPLLVGLGDSFGAAGGPSTNVFRLTAHKLAPSGGPLRVRNLSIGGLAPIDMADLLAVFGEPVSPGDVLVQLVFGGNDFDDAEGELWVAGSYPLRRHPQRTRFDGWLWPRIAVMGVLDRLALRAPPTVAADRHSSAIGSTAFTELIDAAIAYDLQRPGVYAPSFAEMLWREGRRAWQGPEWPDGHAPLRNALRRIGAWTRRRGALWLVVYVPDRAVLDPAVAERIGPPDMGADPDRPRRWLSRAAVDVGVDRYIDLTPAFAEAVNTGATLWLPEDTHWNTAGRRLAAEQIAAALIAVGSSVAQ